MFAQLSVPADLQILLRPRLPMCLEKEKGAGRGALGDTLGVVLVSSAVLAPVNSECCH